MRMLQDRVTGRVTTDDEYGIPSFAREGMLIAVLTNETLLGHVNHVPGHTGATAPTVTGLVAPAPGWVAPASAPTALTGPAAR
jgi:1,6-anhydro-N-acetylmuramate kinase